MIQELITKLFGSLDFIIVALVILGGLFAKNYLSNLNIAVAWKTLMVSTVFVAVYLVVLFYAGDFTRKSLPTVFLSYAVATSLYELILKYVIEGIINRWGNGTK